MGLKTIVAERLVRARTANRVAAGPFRGMVYPPRRRRDAATSMGNSFANKLLGTYELELSSVVDELVTEAPPCVVNVGAGEGYYAVGLARALPAARVVAFEADTAGGDMLATTARLNGVEDRIRIEGACAVEALRELIAVEQPGWLVVDVEGAEDALLDPRRIPGLGPWSLVVEVHERLVPGIGGELAARFGGTHTVERIPTRDRTLADLPIEPRGWARAVPGGLWLKAMDEKRGGPMEWLVLRPVRRAR